VVEKDSLLASTIEAFLSRLGCWIKSKFTPDTGQGLLLDDPTSMTL
jgi:hypothetical protein